jgi:hypothetical protein
MNRFSALALVLLAAGSAQAAEKSLNRSFAVSPGGTLTVDADSASVRVTANDSNQVSVRVRVTGSEDELSNMNLDAAPSADGVTVTLRRNRKGSSWFNWGSWNSDQDIEVTVPRRYNVSVRTGGGGVDLRDTTGSANLRTSGGDVSAKNITGNVELRTSGGTILAEAIRGEVDANTSGGDVRLLNIDGKIRGNTSGGSVRCSLTGSNRGIVATTSGGDIELTLPRSVTGQLEASTSGGDVTTDLPVTTTVVKDGRLSGSMNGGGERIEARTSGGSIRLRAAD